MRRFLLILLSVLIVALAITIGMGWYLLNDESFLKSRLAALVLRETGRELAIDGPLRLDLGRETRIEASGIRFGNAAWAEEPDMARIGHLLLVLDVPSLLGETPVIPLISLEDCAVSLLEREDGASNWEALTETTGEGPGASDSDELPWLLLDAKVRNCSLTHTAPSRPKPLRVEVTELSQRLGENQRWQVNGAATIGKDPFTINGWLAPARSLVLGGPLEHELDVRLGQVTLQSSGTLQDALTGLGANINVSFQGPEIANVLAYLDLPAASTGPFDFRLSLDTEGQMTRLNVDGNLGSIQANAEGELDRLLEPSRGRVAGTIEGPDLALLGAALGLEGLAADAYSLEAEVGFEPGLVRFDLFELALPGDRLSLAGALGNNAELAGTDLDVVASSEDIGRWAAAFGQPVQALGPVALRGRLLTDAKGQASLTARAEYLQNTLALVGKLGLLIGPMQPDLNIDFHSDDLQTLAPLLDDLTLPHAPLTARGRIAGQQKHMLLDGVELNLGGHEARIDGRVNPEQPFIGSELKVQVKSLNAADLGKLFGEERLPAAPFTLSGHIERPDQRIRLRDLVLDLDGHRAEVSGFLNPEETLSGSEIDARLVTPDLASLALLFGREGLPAEPAELSAVLQAEGRGIRFETRQGELGAIRLAAKGHIPDLQNPFGIDADFDIRLPSLTLIAFAAPDMELPDLPFTATGRLHGRADHTELERVRLTLGELATTITGELYPDQRFALTIDATGPDASQLEAFMGYAIAAKPFSLSTRLTGDTTNFEAADISATHGNSRALGNLQVTLNERTRISGRVDAPFLDFSHWNTGEDEDHPASSESSSAYVFDDTKVSRIADYGIELDVVFSAARLDLGNTLMRDIELGVLLGPNHLELSPFSLTREGSGTLRGSAVLDNSGPIPVLDAELAGETLRLGLMVVEGQDIATYPPVDLQLSLHGTGHTRREMASSLNGKLRVYAGSGQIASSGVDLLFSDFLTELLDTLDPFADDGEYTRIDCAVAAADIVDGQVNVQPLVFHTEDITVFSDGIIDLRSEKIKLSFNTKPRKGLGITAGTVINTLIKVGGTLKNPAIEIDPAGAIVGGGTAIATAGLSIVAKSFADRFLSSKDPCGDARKEIAKRDM